jgi:phage terminase large subunit GpA-like protein
MENDSLLSIDEIAAKINGLPERIVPLYCDHVTAFIDIQKALLFYVVVAWGEDFTGAVIDYGTWPKQNARAFTLTSANPTIQSLIHTGGLEGSIYKALERLTGALLGAEWQREDGALLKIERALIDANWGASTDVVYQFCRQTAYSGIILPSHGRYIGASSRPMTEYRKQPGDRLGFNWMVPNVAGKRAIRHVIFDSNFWKSFIHVRLAVPIGDHGSLSFFGRYPDLHQLIAEHLTAEYRVKTVGRGRVVDEWKIRPERRDNHWLDCLVGCAVCASMLGSTLPEFKPANRLKAPLRLSAIQSGALMEANSTAKGTALRLSEVQKIRHLKVDD